MGKYGDGKKSKEAIKKSRLLDQEFKKAQNGFDTQKLGEYFSALSNEANLGQEEFAWLLFGIHDKTHTILGRCLTSRGNGFSLCLTIPLRETECR